MKYYLIAGEASGDLHASHLITALSKADDEATFRFIGGDNMIAAAGQKGTCSQHYKDIAYMGFVQVIDHILPFYNFPFIAVYFFLRKIIIFINLIF